MSNSIEHQKSSEEAAIITRRRRKPCRFPPTDPLSLQGALNVGTHETPHFAYYFIVSTAYPVLRLASGKEAHLKNRHHAIFKTAVTRFPEVPDGSIVEVQSFSGDFLCYALLNRKAYICGRAIAFERGDPLRQIKTNIEHAIAMRETFFAGEDTNAYRLINAEGDGIPGLIVDKYASVIVVQFTTLGMDMLRENILQMLRDACSPQCIFEKSTGAARKSEGLESKEGWIGEVGPEEIPVTERGLRFMIRLEGSQKTGLFLDQREMRSLVKATAKGRTVLDCCSYVGGFSVAALAGGAKSAHAVDYDATALSRAADHVKQNGLDVAAFSSSSEDVFNVLRKKPAHPFDFIILDPPAFAKRSSDLDQAKRAYTDLNRMAMEILPAGGLLLTCSCSYQVDPELFQTIVFHAARQAKR